MERYSPPAVRQRQIEAERSHIERLVFTNRHATEMPHDARSDH
jgi:hypothetical protein